MWLDDHTFNGWLMLGYYTHEDFPRWYRWDKIVALRCNARRV